MISTVTSFGATRVIMSSTRRIAGLSRHDRPPELRFRPEPRVLQPQLARLDPRFTASTSSSGSNGFGR